jgi:hypothetical protein
MCLWGMGCGDGGRGGRPGGGVLCALPATVQVCALFWARDRMAGRAGNEGARGGGGGAVLHTSNTTGSLLERWGEVGRGPAGHLRVSTHSFDWQ